MCQKNKKRRLKCTQYRTGVWIYFRSLPADSSPSTGYNFWTHGCTIFIQYWAAVWKPHIERERERAQFFPVPALDKNRSPKKVYTKRVFSSENQVPQQAKNRFGAYQMASCTLGCKDLSIYRACVKKSKMLLGQKRPILEFLESRRT